MCLFINLIPNRMNTTDNPINELENATPDTDHVEPGESTPDWQQPAEQPTISANDFWSESQEPSQEDIDKTENKKIEKARNQKQIEDSMFDKYVIQEDWSFSFDNLPHDLKWTEKGIRDRYLQEQETPKSNQTVDVTEIENRIYFKQKLDWLVASEDISAEDKVAIKDKFQHLKSIWITDDLVALSEAESFVLNTTSPKPVWVMPQGWRAPSFSWNQITYEQLDSLSQSDYNATMAKVDAGEITLK